MEFMSAQAAIKAGKLERILPEWQLARGGIYAVLPPGRHVPAKVRAFIDFIESLLPEHSRSLHSEHIFTSQAPCTIRAPPTQKRAMKTKFY